MRLAELDQCGRHWQRCGGIRDVGDVTRDDIGEAGCGERSCSPSASELEYVERIVSQ
jgi:hypothetical protein